VLERFHGVEGLGKFLTIDRYSALAKCGVIAGLTLEVARLLNARFLRRLPATH
jgi:hypothetical protein